MTDGNGIQRHLAVAAGKDAHIYIADRDNMARTIPPRTARCTRNCQGLWGPLIFQRPLFSMADFTLDR